MSIERELMRGAGPAAVLSLLGDRPMYGYELVEALSNTTDGLLAMGQSTLYPLLYNLESKKLVATEWIEADSGRKRKYYSLTARGRKELAKQRKQWSEVRDAMERLGVI